MCPRYYVVFSALCSSLWHKHTHSEAAYIREHQYDSKVTQSEHNDQRHWPEGEFCPGETHWQILTDTLSCACRNTISCTRAPTCAHTLTYGNVCHIRTQAHTQICLPYLIRDPKAKHNHSHWHMHSHTVSQTHTNTRVDTVIQAYG